MELWRRPVSDRSHSLENKKQLPPTSASRPDRCLTLLAEGAAQNMLEADSDSHRRFREKIALLSLKMPDRLPEDDKIALIRQVLHEFEQYRKHTEESLRERLSGWRALVSFLLGELLSKLGRDSASPEANLLVQRSASLLTCEEIHSFRLKLADFLRLGGEEDDAGRRSWVGKADRSNANHNPAGLRGGGAAIEHVRRMMEAGLRGFVVLFQLNCLEVIGERFGVEAVQDSLMAVAAFLTHSLRSDDAIYHWSDNALLGVLNTPASEPIIFAAMQRIVSNNRDITIQIGGRTVMLRVPLEFCVTPLSRLRSAEDLNKLSIQAAVER
jgi:GGDEF domain-containing protein